MAGNGHGNVALARHGFRTRRPQGPDPAGL